MILPKKHIRLAVHRNYIKRTIRNLSNDMFEKSEISLIVVSKRKILDFEKDILRTEIKTLLINILNK
jgi:ribonuclease P protein component